jgi:hypothetical protein
MQRVPTRAALFPGSNPDQIQNVEDAIQTIQAVWPEFPQEFIDRLVESFSNPVRMTEKPEGHAIQPLISREKLKHHPGTLPRE